MRLGLEVAVGVLSGDGDRHAAQSRLLALLQIQELQAIAVVLGPARVHAQQNLRPVAGVRPAGTGVDGDDGVGGVVLPAEQARELGGVEAALDGDELFGGFAPRVRVIGLRGELEEHLRVLEVRLQAVVDRELPLHRGLLAQELLRLLAVAPELRVGGAGLQVLLSRAQATPVKDAPGALRSDCADRAGARKAPDR
jgi:hypothetical protein